MCFRSFINMADMTDMTDTTDTFNAPVPSKEQVEAQWALIKLNLIMARSQWAMQTAKSQRISKETLEMAEPIFSEIGKVDEDDDDDDALINVLPKDEDLPDDFPDISELDRYQGFEQNWIPLEGKLYKDNLTRLQNLGYDVETRVIFKPQQSLVYLTTISWG